MTEYLSDLAPIISVQPYPLLFATVSGSHLYGFPSADSDFDLRGVHILPLPKVIGLISGEETIEVSEVREGMQLDLVTHDIKKFFEMLLKRNGYVLEQLYSPLIVYSTKEHEELKAIASNCITKHHSHHYLGFAQTQWKLFEKERPRRVKPLLYVYRVLLAGIHLMQTGEVEANLVKLNEKFQLSYIPDLIDRKLAGEEKSVLEDTDIEFYQQERDRLINILEDASFTSHLPSNPNAKVALNDFLVKVRMSSLSCSTFN
ncbi:nucleotidyltransferase domain-containing protein [Microcoleus vaginatus GB1-A2]|uniref:nucleotidyltransferase domain-containing protein n=1 Tax=Microcoleus vaginatus TaxID=119532 RepID=UPI0016876E6E|nr:nucleotidyltransferase domain-containing protein [Microcoleus sp. FACHB-61]